VKLAIASLIAVVAALLPAVGVRTLQDAEARPAGRAAVENAFVAAANRGDYAAVCRLYSHRYLKDQATCRALYRWGESLYGPYDYRIVGRRTVATGHRHVDLVLRRHHSFLELARERAGWRIVAGGF
jgi:hypothetical protein